jgi:hypothetical protein
LTQSSHDEAVPTSPTNRKNSNYNILLGRQKRGGEMNTRKSTAVRQIGTILAALMVWGCGQQGPTDSSNDTPTVNQAALASPKDEGPLFAATKAALEQDGIENWTFMSLISTQEQWLPTGLQVEAGRPLTIFGFGALMLDSLRLEPRNLAWVRIGEDGDLIKLASNQITFEPDRSGQLYLTVRPLGMYWESPAGNFPEDMSGSPSSPIDMNFIAVQWPDPQNASERFLLSLDSRSVRCIRWVR